jgi:hypothetical protein
MATTKTKPEGKPKPRRAMTGIAIMVGVLTVTSCSREEAAPEKGAGTSASAAPQPWEPFDEGFRGCEGG